MLQSFCEKHRLDMEKWSADEWQKQLAALFTTIHETIRATFVKDQTGGAGEGGADAKKGSPAAGSSAGGSASKRYVDDKGIVRAPGGDPIHGGTTGSLVAMVRTPEDKESPAYLVTANVGDSTAVLMPLQPRNKNAYEFLTVVRATRCALCGI